MDFLKKRSAWLLALVLPLLLFARGAMAEEWTNLDDEIMKRGTVRIGIGYSTPPMNYLDDKGQPAGFDVDLAKALCEKMGLRYTITKVNNKTRITSLVSGETDMVLSNMNHTMSRARQIDFSDTYLLDGKRVLAAKGRYHALKDFVGRRVAVCQGSNAQQAVTEALKKLGDPSPRVMSFYESWGICAGYPFCNCRVSFPEIYDHRKCRNRKDNRRTDDCPDFRSALFCFELWTGNR